MNKLEQTINFLSNMEKVFYQDFVNNSDDMGIKRDEVKQLRHVISLLEMFDPRVLLFDNPSILDVLRNLLPITISDFFLSIISNISNTKEG